jgi:hypothetical protein
MDNKPIPVAYVTATLLDNFLTAAKYGFVIEPSGRQTSSAAYLDGLLGMAASSGGFNGVMIAIGKKMHAKDPQDFQRVLSSWTYAAALAASPAVLVLVPAGIALVALAPVAAVASIFAVPILSKNRVCTIVIANALQGSLVRKDHYYNCGFESAHPAIVDPDDGSESNAHTIEGLLTLPPSVSPEPLFGVGAYRFEKDLSLGIGFYGTGGAISFTSSDPATNGKVMAISWLVPENGNPGCGVTADLSAYKNLEDFYMQTADKGHQERVDIQKSFNLHATFWPRNFDSATGAQGSIQDLVLSVSVKQGS